MVLENDVPPGPVLTGSNQPSADVEAACGTNSVKDAVMQSGPESVPRATPPLGADGNELT